MKHYTVPIFVPELACPNRCVFCNQNSISGCHDQPSSNEVIETIELRLSTLPKQGAHIEIGFFGGNFTGIDEWQQKEYLGIAQSYFLNKKVHGIRLSTRPDYITSQSLELLKNYNVTTIELGAQSLDDEVLKLAGRGHTVADIVQASKLIRSQGFRLGLQMMTGLPGDTTEKSISTAMKIIELGASDTRIYPTLVIKNTELEQQWLNGTYKPQSLDEAVMLAATLIDIFTNAGINIIRVGLHPSDDLLQGKDMLDGPFHPSFRQLAESERWRRKLTNIIKDNQVKDNQDKDNQDKNSNILPDSAIEIPVPADEINEAIGFGGSNREFLLKHFKEVTFKPEGDKMSLMPLIISDKRIPLPAKNALRNLGDLCFTEESFAVYRSIAGHPDIFLCAGDDQVVVSPDLSLEIIEKIKLRGYTVINGSKAPEGKYPGTAGYNAVITANHLIHNLKITDEVILNTFGHKKKLHVNQGYTRCNLLALTDTRFITSDRGIEKILLEEGLEVLWVDPTPVVLKGQKHGFFPGACGIMGDTVIINGNLSHHPQGELIRDFILYSELKAKELFNGKITDAGSILSFKHKNNF